MNGDAGPRLRPGSGLLVAGTGSGVGKSALVTGLCRWLARQGMRVAPFKAQNMSNNSMVCRAGDSWGEIGRAQWIQAVAAQATPEVAMNPVLLKPGSDYTSHVVLRGQPAGTLDASNFLTGRGRLAEAAFAAFDDLRSRFDIVIAEGAGSAAEPNLREADFVNMGLARHATMPVIVVGDIDPGGVFAALFGTVGLLDAADRDLVRGFVINKFRGERCLLTPAVEELERRTGVPVLGVLPWRLDMWLDSEDTLDPAPLAAGAQGGAGVGLRVALVRLPHVSNATDVDPLAAEPGVELVIAARPRDLAGADLVVLPGTRATLADLAWLQATGMDAAIARHAAGGGAVLGICGGMQMLGERVEDPDGVEGGGSAAGLGLLPVVTRFGQGKVVRLAQGSWEGQPVEGYELHHGAVDVRAGATFPGGVSSANVWGTMWHGCLEADGFRDAWLTQVAQAAGAGWAASGTNFAALREARIDALAQMIDQYVDTDRLTALLG